MSEQGPHVSYPVRQLADDLRRELREAEARLLAKFEEVSVHFDHVRSDTETRLERLSKDFGGFEHRFSLHEVAPVHSRFELTYEHLEGRLKMLEDDKARVQAVERARDEMVSLLRESRRYAIGQFFASLSSLAALGVLIWDIFLRHN